MEVVIGSFCCAVVVGSCWWEEIAHPHGSVGDFFMELGDFEVAMALLDHASRASVPG